MSLHSQLTRCLLIGRSKVNSLRMRSSNNELNIGTRNLMQAVDQKPDYQLEWP